MDEEIYRSVNTYLQMEYDDAVLWSDGSVLYFQIFSKLPIHERLEKPKHDLTYYIINMSREKLETDKMAKSIMQSMNKE